MANKIKISSENIYVMATLTTALGTALLAIADFGVSMLVAPSYIISLKISCLTFGQTGYLIQALLFVIFCFSLKKIKPIYFFSFISGFLFGTVLDMWRMLVPLLNPQIQNVETLPVTERILYFIAGFLLNSFGVSLYFKTYLYPQVFELFVKEISKKYNIKLSKFKICFDITWLSISLILSFLLFKKMKGIGVGTIVIACLNGPMITLYHSFFEKYINIKPRFEKIAQLFK